MYETIQGLPLFKGTTAEQISAFLEKTHIEFKNFEPGMVLIEAGEPCADIRFVISGKVKTRMPLADGRAILSTIVGAGAVFSPVHLFGLYTHYPLTVEGISEGSFMVIRKNQYLDLVQSDPIYLLNYINYLSFHAQRAQKALRIKSDNALERWLYTITAGLLERRALRAQINTNLASLAEILNVTEDEVIRCLDLLPEDRVTWHDTRRLSITLE